MTDEERIRELHEALSELLTAYDALYAAVGELRFSAIPAAKRHRIADAMVNSIGPASRARWVMEGASGK